MGAKAFTVGQDVHFGARQFAPGTKEGDRLLAHELTHTVQAQKSGVQRKAEPAEGHEGGEHEQEVSQPHEPAEKEADAVGDHVAEKLHGGDKHPGEDGVQKERGAAHEGKAGQVKAPEIGAKLHGVGLKVFRSQDKEAKVKELALKEAMKLLEVAAANEKGITETLTAVASANGGEMKGLEEHRLKSLDSLARKIADRADVRKKEITVEEAVAKSVAKINDALRYTVQLPPDTYRKGAAAIHAAMTGKGFQVTAQKNFWDLAGTELEFPYRGINMTVKHPKGQVFEIQFHTPESLAMKSELHKLYEEWRDTKTKRPRRAEIERIMKDKWRTVPVPQ